MRWIVVSDSHKRVNPKSREGECFYCKIALTPTTKEHSPTMGTIDHVLPKSKGGWDTTINQVWSCWACNQEKSNQLPGQIHLDALGLKLVEIIPDQKYKLEMVSVDLSNRYRPHMDPKNQERQMEEVNRNGKRALERRFGAGAYKHCRNFDGTAKRGSADPYRARRKPRTSAQIINNLIWSDDEDDE